MWSNSHLSRAPADIMPANLDCLEYRAAHLVDGRAANAVCTHDFVRESVGLGRMNCVAESIADVSSVPYAVYPDSEVFSIVFKNVPFRD